jgi:hypothetical protein
LSRFPDKADHQNLRTSRDRNLKTADEQDSLFGETIAVIGLSVGSKALGSLVEGGIGGSYIIGDGDFLDPTNINRIDAGYTDVGLSKVDIAAKKISEKDPWLEQIHLKSGLHADQADTLAQANLIVEEVDNLAVKALIRLKAQEYGIPLVMAADIADRSVIDVERYDVQDRKNLMFNGRITPAQALEISRGDLSPGENSRYMLKHTGVRHLSTRMMKSVMAIGSELGGLPQLGTTATKGGADVAFAAREILLGRTMSSGRYVDDPRRTFKLPRSEASLLETAKTAVKLVKHARTL